MGRESWLFLEAPRLTRTARLTLRCWPHTQPDLLPRQRLALEVNRRLIASAEIAHRSLVTGLIEPEWLAGREMLALRVIHPDGARPCDFPRTGNDDARALAVACEALELEELQPDECAILHALTPALEQAVPLPAPPGSRALRMAPLEVMKAFESAGDDCEFGFVQRHYGLEALGLLRFTGIGLDDLARGLKHRFAGLAKSGSLRMVTQQKVPNQDIMGEESTYGLSYHTYRFANDTDAAALLKQEVRRLPRLAAKYLEDVETGEKIFIVKSTGVLAPVQVASLLAAFRRVGPAPMLWIRQAPPGVPHGTACRLMPGLMMGYVDRLAPPPLLDMSPESWLAACRAALALMEK